MSPSRPRVLCIDDDRDIVEVVSAILEDEGYAPSFLSHIDDDAVLQAIGRLEPDAVLLDSVAPDGYRATWDLATTIRSRPRSVPVVMFSAHARDVAEARAATSKRAEQAGFAAILPKPFHLDELLEAVAQAVGRSEPFDRSRRADESRTHELVQALRARGATDVRPSKMREWALFRDLDGALRQIYWWQARGVYKLGRYRECGELVTVGEFMSRDEAIEFALPSPESSVDAES